jgi:hypothetical protein
MFGPEVDEQIQAHALEAFPHECCGVVRAGVYERMVNNDPNPTEAFDFDRMVLIDPAVQAIVHSHPNGPAHPSAMDMMQQLATDLVWGLVATDGESCQPVMWWGPGVPVPPLVGRDFRHGPSGSDGKGDCYAMVRDWYREHRGLKLPEVPRDNEWWAKGQSLYTDHLEPEGFQSISISQIEPGDGLLLHVLSTVPNHAAIYMGDGLILHHLPNRLSRHEPLGRWINLVTHAIRPPQAEAPPLPQPPPPEGSQP